MKLSQANIFDTSSEFGVPALGRQAALYIHIPFCIRKCPYCSFYSIPYNQTLADRLISAIIQELNNKTVNIEITTIFIGGGTPTILPIRKMEALLKAINNLGATHSREISIEANPATITPDYAKLLKDLGVTRVSLGVQSLNDRILKILGRPHNSKAAIESFDILRKAGFDNINIDLIYGVPYQSLNDWSFTLAQTFSLKPDHLSCYELTIEEDSAFMKLFPKAAETDEETSLAMYNYLRDNVSKADLVQYEISNFASRRFGQKNDIPLLACSHNINYWRGGQYIGIGPSATSYLNNDRFQNIKDVIQYCECVEKNRDPTTEHDILTPIERAGEIAGFGLRVLAGWPFALFKIVTGFDLLSTWAKEIENLIKKGLIIKKACGLQLSSKGIIFADEVAKEFLKIKTS